MKKLVTSYTFDASEKTVTSADFTSLEKIQLITNVTDNIIIYNFADSTKGGTLSSTTLTLTYDTTSMADADKLQIFVEDAAAIQPVSDGGSTISIDDGGSSITVDGTFWQATQPVSAASLPLPSGAATSAKQDTIIGHVDGIEGLLTTIDADTGTIAGAVSGSEVQVDVVGALPAGDNNIGNVDIVTMPDATVVGKAAHDAAVAGNPVLLAGYASAAAPTDVSADGDVARIWTTLKGAVHVADGGSSLTVDGSVTVSATNLDIRDIDKAADDITVFANTAKDGSGTAYVPLVDTDGHLQVDVLSGGGGGTQYTEGDTDSTITGTAMLWEDTSDTLRAVSSAKPLPVNVVSGGTAGTQYTEGDTDASITGTAMLWEDGSDTLRAVSASKPLPVDLQDSTVAVTQSGTWNITNVSGTVSLPTGAATAAKQDLIIADTGSIASDAATIASDTGTIAGSTTNIETAVQLLDDTVATDGSAAVTKLLQIGGTDGTNAQILSTNTSGHVNIADGGNTITVDGSVTVSATNLDIRDLTQSADTVRIYANTAKDGSGTAYIPLLDTDGHLQVDVLSGGGTQYTEDDAAAGNPVGTMGIAVRADSLAAVTSTDGDNIALRATNKGELYVKQTDAVPVTDNGSTLSIDDGAGSITVDGTVAATQSGTWTLGANSGVDIGDVTINNASGASAVNIQDGGNSITVDNGGTFAVQATVAASATNIAKAEDVASADADVGVPAMAVRKATPANTSGTDGDYEMLQMSAGRLWTSATIDAAIPAGTNAIGKLASNTGVTIGAVEIASSQTLATVTTLTGGGIAHDGTDSGNPHKVGAKATTALSGVTLVANADRTDLYAGVDGVLITREDSGLEDKVSGTASNTDGNSTQVIAASGAGVKTYLTDVTLVNTSASMIYVEIKDGTSAKWVFPVPATGGVTHHFRTPLAGTANTAWNFDPSAATTTVYCSAAGFKSKV